MTERRLPVLWPLGPLPVVLPGIAIFAIVLASTVHMFSWPYQEWIRTSAEFHQQNAFAAPVAGAAATYYAGRLTPPSRIFALPTAARAGYPTVVRHILVLNGSFLAAYVLGLIPLLIATTRDAEYGAPSVLVIVTGILGISAAIVVGYFLGVLGRSALLTPVSFVLLFAATMAGTSGDRFSALAPVLHMSPALGQLESLPFVVYRIAFLVCVVTVLILVSGRLLKEHRGWSRWPRPQSLMLAAVPVLMVVPPLADKPALFDSESAPPRVCEVRRGVEYCVHAGHRSQLQPMIEAVDPVIEVYGITPRRVARVYDSALLGATQAGDSPVWFHLDPNNPVHTDLVSVTAVLSGWANCFEKYRPELLAQRVTAPAGEAIGLAQGLDGWLKFHGAPPDGRPFRKVSLSVMQDWIARNDDRISSCSLRKEDVPT